MKARSQGRIINADRWQKRTITVEQGLLTGDHTGTAAWLVDGGTRLLRQREKFKKEPVAECCWTSVPNQKNRVVIARIKQQSTELSFARFVQVAAAEIGLCCLHGLVHFLAIRK